MADPPEEFATATVSTIGRVGDPVATVIRTAVELDARYLVIGGRRRTPGEGHLREPVPIHPPRSG